MYNTMGGNEEEVGSCPHDIQYIEHLEQQLDALKKENRELKELLRKSIYAFSRIEDCMNEILSVHETDKPPTK